jgi:hypothetical protein
LLWSCFFLLLFFNFISFSFSLNSKTLFFFIFVPLQVDNAHPSSGILAVSWHGGEEGVEQVVLLIGLIARPVSRHLHALQGLLSRHPERLQATAGYEPCPPPQP